jgi:hypothetical protein
LPNSPRHNHSANATISASFFGNLGIVRGQKTKVRDQKKTCLTTKDTKIHFTTKGTKSKAKGKSKKEKSEIRATSDELAILIDHLFRAFRNSSTVSPARGIDLDFLCNFNAFVNNFR